MARGSYSKLCSKNRGQLANEPVRNRQWMKSNFELNVHGASKSSTSNDTLGGMLYRINIGALWGGIYLQHWLYRAEINADNLSNS
jgi:hypothetical protein